VIDCLRKRPETKPRICNARELQGSHAGGTDYGPACVQAVNENGRHRGNHMSASKFKYSWAPGLNDRWDDGSWRGSERYVDIRFVENPIFKD
jgi:hypothetical protein